MNPVDISAQHSVHARVTGKPGRKRLADIKLLQDDPAAVAAESEEIKAP